MLVRSWLLNSCLMRGRESKVPMERRRRNLHRKFAPDTEEADEMHRRQTISIQRRDNGRAIERKCHSGWFGGHITGGGRYLGDTMDESIVTKVRKKGCAGAR